MCLCPAKGRLREKGARSGRFVTCGDMEFQGSGRIDGGMKVSNFVRL